MPLKFLKKHPKNQIGLDITPEGITAVLLDKEDKKYYVKKHAYQSFQEETIQNGYIINPKSFVSALSKLITNNDFNTELVNIAVPSNASFIKTVTLPDLPLEELKIIAPQETSKHLPIPISEVNFDFEVIESTKRQEDSINKVDIVLVALTKTLAKNYVDLIAESGLMVAAIDIAPFAMIRTLGHSGLIDNSDCLYMSVLIGYENTDINIIHRGMPLFSHNTPVGKKNVIDSVVTALGIDSLSAEKLLAETELVMPGMNVNPDPQLNKAATAVRAIYNSISTEIQNTIEFYSSHEAEPKEIKKIIIGGSGICVQNIDKYIAGRLRVETVLCDSLGNISSDSEYLNQVNVPALATSVGLALKGLEN